MYKQKQSPGGVLKSFAKVTAKHLLPQFATLLRMRLLYRCYPVNFAKFLMTRSFYETAPLVASVLAFEVTSRLPRS